MATKTTWCLAILALCLAERTLARERRSKAKDPGSYLTCSECIDASPSFVWCAKEGYPRDPRCQQRRSEFALPCWSNLVDTAEQVFTVLKDRQLKRNRPISPQRASLQMRVGARTEFPIKVLPSKKSLKLKFRYPRRVKLTIDTWSCRGFKWDKKSKMASCETTDSYPLTFTVTVEMRKCLPKPKKIKVTVKGMKRSLKISLTPSCGCDCDKPSEVVKDSTSCTNRGAYRCGMCYCNSGYHGKACECDDQDVDAATSQAMCTFNNTVCSGNGECVCGVCNCFGAHRNAYSGQYCECDHVSCPVVNGLCGGTERGVCKCGKCECREGYSGDACQLSDKTDMCRAISGLLCDGHGDCVNNRCVCRGDRFGPLCSICPQCPGECTLLQPCVACLGYNNCSTLSQAETENCRRFQVQMVDDYDDEYSNCVVSGGDWCVYNFAYKRAGPDVLLRIQNARECSP